MMMMTVRDGDGGVDGDNIFSEGEKRRGGEGSSSARVRVLSDGE